MLDRFIGKKDFADLAGVSPQAITKNTKEGKVLEHSVVNGKIDLSTPGVAQYLASKEKDVPEFKNGPAFTMEVGVGDETPTGEFMHMTVAEVTARLGSDKNFKSFLDARKTIADIAIKDLQAAEKRGELIPRQTVKTFIFGALEQCNHRLLRDLPKTAIQRLSAHFESGGSEEEATRILLEMVSKNLSTAQNTISRIMKDDAA